MARLEARAKALLAEEVPFFMAGDYNVIPQDTDAANPKAWTKDALALPQSREAFRRLLNLGLSDAFRLREFAPGHYSFWDYQAGAWERNNGIRIDHFLLSPAAADMLQATWIESDMRGRTKPSDHVPVWIDIDL